MIFPKPDRNGDMVELVKKSSEGRLWSGVDASIRSTSGGYIKTPLLGRHIISTLLGYPVKSECRCYNKLYRRYQRPDDIDIIPIGYVAEWHDDGPTGLLLVELDATTIEDAATSMGIKAPSLQLVPQLQIRDPFIRHILLAFKAELETNAALGGLFAASLGLSLASYLLSVQGFRRPVIATGQFSKRQKSAVLDFVGDHLAESITIADLAAVIGVSQSHFKTQFKASFGLAPHQYIVRARVERAVHLLQLQKQSLSHIAVHSGFADQSHLARWVRRITGKTLTAVRSETNGHLAIKKGMERS